ncbi:MAG: hypothetical protein J7L51_00025 [Desulfurococcales archaeon]|nr:hypothetical protein [Desulfurococcales archaeon]
MKFHVHVYKVVGKLELDIEANDELEAEKEALELAEETTDFQEPKSQFIVFLHWKGTPTVKF